MQKKLLILLSALCLFCLVIAGCGKNVPGSSIPSKGLPQKETEGLVYELSADKTYYAVTDYTGTSTQVFIPEKHNDLPVQSIGGAFSGCKSLQSVTIPDSVQSIGKYAFENCTSLQSVTIPNSVQSIGNGAFDYCTSLQSVTIPDSVQSIGAEAFRNCYKLQSVYITDLDAWCEIDFNNYDSNPLYLAENLYLNSELVTNLEIPNTVTQINDCAFYWCTSLQSVTIPNSVQSIGAEAFSGCSSLQSVTIPNSVQSIGRYVFRECTSLQSVTIGNSVEFIDDGAFRDCYKLVEVYNLSSLNIGIGFALDVYTSLDMPSKLSTDENGFVIRTDGETKTLVNYVGTASEIAIPNTITIIGKYAFYGCKSLQSVTIPNSVQSIDIYAFGGCHKLVEVYNLSSLNITKGSDDKGCVAYYAFDVYTSLETPSKLSTDENGFVIRTDGKNKTLVAYVGTASEIEIPNTVTRINAYAYDCDLLQSVTIPDSVQSIGNYAFYGCKSLQSVTIGNGVQSIGEDAFYWCPSLQSITIGNSVQSIGDDAFKFCKSLQSVYITDLDAWCKISFSDYYSNPLYCAENLYLNSELVTNLEIPNTVTQISAYAFSDCTSLQSVTIPNSVQSIGNGAFDYCTSLQSVTIGNGVQSIGENAFDDCDSLQSVTIGNSVQSIGENAFRGCRKLVEVYNLSSLNIKKGSTNYGYVGCYALDVYTSLKTPSKLSTDAKGFVIHTDGKTKTLVKYIGTARKITIPNTITKINNYAFFDCDSLQSVTIPNSVKSIGAEAFSFCSSLQSVTIPDGVQSIGDDAFSLCSSLQSVIIGNSVQSIGNNAFSGCSSLQSVTIPNSVQSIGRYVFSLCYNLESITFEDTSTWYRTDDSTAWQNKTGGTETSVAMPTTNATYFTSTDYYSYYRYYWYKL